MTQVHGKTAGFLVGTADISAVSNEIQVKQSADVADSTTFGNTGHTYLGGLTDGKVTVKGIYDNAATTGPRAAIQAHLGNVVACKYHPEGTGTGKPEDTFNAVVSAYEETAPVADIISWSAEFQISGGVTSGTQT